MLGEYKIKHHHIHELKSHLSSVKTFVIKNKCHIKKNIADNLMAKGD